MQNACRYSENGMPYINQDASRRAALVDPGAPVDLPDSHVAELTARLTAQAAKPRCQAACLLCRMTCLQPEGHDGKHDSCHQVGCSTFANRTPASGPGNAATPWLFCIWPVPQHKPFCAWAVLPYIMAFKWCACCVLCALKRVDMHAGSSCAG